jgi:hypothetical protein
VTYSIELIAYVYAVRTSPTNSRRPSAAAGCARLASLAVLAGQHQDRQRQEFEP